MYGGWSFPIGVKGYWIMWEDQHLHLCGGRALVDQIHLHLWKEDMLFMISRFKTLILITIFV